MVSESDRENWEVNRLDFHAVPLIYGATHTHSKHNHHDAGKEEMIGSMLDQNTKILTSNKQCQLHRFADFIVFSLHL